MARNSVVIDLEIRNRDARKALQGVGSDFTRLSQKTTRATKSMQTGFKRASQQVAGSQNAVMNLSRIVEDAPFGIRGVANNINPFIESFQRLKTEAGSTRGALMSLLSGAFTGPGALITISSLVSSALVAIQMGILDLGDGSKQAEEDLKQLLEAANELRDIASGEFGLADALENEIERNQRAIELAEKRVDLEQDLAEARITVGSGMTDAQREQIKALEEQIEATNSLITTLGFESTEVQDLEANLRKLRLEQDLLTDGAGQADLKLRAFLDRIDTEAQQVLQRYTSGVDENSDAVRAQITQIENVIGSFQLLARQGEEDLIPIISALQSTVKELNDELDQTEKKTSSAFQPLATQYALRAQQRRGVLPMNRPEGQVLDPAGSPFDLPEPPKDWLEEEQKKMERMIAGFDDIEEAGTDSMDKLAVATDIVGNALAQAIIRGEKLGGVLKSLAAQLGSKALINGLAMLLSGGSFGIGKLLFGSAGDIIGGAAHGVDNFGGGLLRVGERGEELVALPPASAVINNENLEFLQRHRREARSGAEVIASMRSGQIRNEMLEALQMVNWSFEARTEGSDLVYLVRQELELQERLGGNGTL